MGLGFGFAFLAAAILALPGGLLCVLAEVIGARHRPPSWLGILALVLAVCCLLLVFRVIGPGGDRGWFIFPVPPLMTLALVSLLPAPRWRLIAVWLVATSLLGLLAHAFQQLGSATTPAEGLGVLLGGALSSMLPWQLAFVLQQRAWRRAGRAPPAAPSFTLLHEFLRGAGRAGNSEQGPGLGVLARRHGLGWWLAGATIFYLGVMGLSVLGINALPAAMLSIEWRISEFVGMALQAPDESVAAAWAGSGLAWSAIIGGGVWGVAASTGRFDSGRLAPFRLTSILLATLMLGWIATTLFRMHN